MRPAVGRALKPVPVLVGVGLVAVVIGIALEFADVAARAQLWSASVGALSFLAAVALHRDDGAAAMVVRSRLLIGASAAALLAVVGLWQSTTPRQTPVLLLLVPVVLLLTGAALALREAGRIGRRARVARMRWRVEGQESERRRWARELHDETLQDLAVIEIHLARIVGDPEAGPLAAELEQVRDVVRTGISTLRHLVAEMRPLAVDVLGLACALDQLAERTSATAGVEIRRELAALPTTLDPEAEVAVYRVVQEALNNAVRHSGGRHIAVSAGVIARYGGNHVRVTVSDDGTRYADPVSEPAGYGTLGMVERAVALDGGVTWATLESGGTRVELTFPLHDHPAASGHA